LANEIEPLHHLKILDDDDDSCLVASTMIEEDHKPFSFLLQQQTSQMSKRRRPNRLYPRGLGTSHDFLGQPATFSKKLAIFFKTEKIAII
jgi:hypothetical protein